MIYKKGDKGLVPQTINYRLGLHGDTYTEDTRTRVMQFQSTYNYLPEDTSMKNIFKGDIYVGPETPYTQYEQTFDPTSNNDTRIENYPLDSENNINLRLFPNGVVDIQTMTALLDIDVEEFNERTLSQVQETLSVTEYSDNKALEPTGLYDIPTRNAIRKFQKKYMIGQQKYPIIEGKNILPNDSKSWKNQKYIYHSEIKEWGNGYKYDFISPAEGNSGIVIETSNTCILSKFIPIEVNQPYYVSMYGVTKEEYRVRILFFKSPIEKNDNNEMITSLSTKEVEVSGFTKWVSTEIPENTEGLIPINSFLPQGLNTPYTIRFIRVEIVRKDGGTITPQDVENLMIQIEKGNKGTAYEPNSNTPSNMYFSGYLNIPTYAKIKSIYNLKEGVF